MSIIYCDEAGNSGEHLFDHEQPFFVLASNDYSAEEANSILDHVRSTQGGEPTMLKGSVSIYLRSPNKLSSQLYRVRQRKSPQDFASSNTRSAVGRGRRRRSENSHRVAARSGLARRWQGRAANCCAAASERVAGRKSEAPSAVWLWGT